jgi:DinB superfamily
VNPLAHAILITWKRNGAYGRRLVEDLAPDQWLAQPISGRVMNHPAWIVSHLNVYAPIAAALCRGAGFDDPIDHRFGQKSKVALDPAEYAKSSALLAEYSRLHIDAQAALEIAGDGVFAAPNPLERWRAVHPSVGDMLVTLMVKHESGHLGQLSAWRRALGLASVPM